MATDDITTGDSSGRKRHIAVRIPRATSASTSINFRRRATLARRKKEIAEDASGYRATWWIRYIPGTGAIRLPVPPLNVRRYIILEEGGNTCLIQFQEHARRRPLNFSSASGEVTMPSTYHGWSVCARLHALHIHKVCVCAPRTRAHTTWHLTSPELLPSPDERAFYEFYT